MNPQERITVAKNQLDEFIYILHSQAKSVAEEEEYLTAELFKVIAQRLTNIKETLEN